MLIVICATAEMSWSAPPGWNGCGCMVECTGAGYSRGPETSDAGGGTSEDER